jgi:hypothetical protein
MSIVRSARHEGAEASAISPMLGFTMAMNPIAGSSVAAAM